MSPKSLFITGLILVLGLGLLLSVKDARNQPLDFDGSYNLQVAEELAHEGKYADFNMNHVGRTIAFDPVITTGPTVLLPIAVSFKLFGVGVTQFRIVMIAFYVALIGLTSCWVYRITKSPYSVIAGLIVLLLGHIIYLHVDYLDVRTDPIGEIPAALFSVAACYYWQKRSMFVAGLCIALAILAKFICIFFLPVIFISFVVLFYQKKLRIYDATWFFAGLMLPLLVWEAYHLIALASVSAYIANWRAFIHYFKEAGSGVTRTANATYQDKLVALWHTTLSPWWIKLAVLASVGIGCIIYLFSLYVLEAGYLYKHLYIANLVTVLCIANLLQLVATHYPISLTDQQTVAAAVVKQYPSQLVHDGWWQNPDIIFLAHERSYPVLTVPASYEPMVQVISPLMRTLNPEQYTHALARCQDTLLSLKEYVVCRL